MGRDKYENEELIKYSFPEDIWFHVDNFSSAHVYIRLPKGSTMDNLSEQVLEDMAQLTKANSIEGSGDCGPGFTKKEKQQLNYYRKQI